MVDNRLILFQTFFDGQLTKFQQIFTMNNDGKIDKITEKEWNATVDLNVAICYKPKNSKQVQDKTQNQAESKNVKATVKNDAFKKQPL